MRGGWRRRTGGSGFGGRLLDGGWERGGGGPFFISGVRFS